ncbi:hypothetical protein [Paenibacillus amylolyticus]|uniref:Uncharacterized protein n=1 Tax=Paenibacillus amylolyticus TaxID=1451 RepID=A0ABD8B2V5_PAEAM
MDINELTYPNIKFIKSNSMEDLEKSLQLSRPDLILVREDDVYSVLKEASKYSIDLAVLVNALSSTLLRKYTADGVKHVWGYENWIEEIGQEYDLVVPNDQKAEKEEDQRTFDFPTRTTFIAVGGVYDGAGSTHTSLMLAQYLAYTTRKPVGVWEAGPNPRFGFYDFVLNGDRGTERSRFEVGNVTLFKGDVDYSQIKSVAQDFTYFIIDLGRIEGMADSIEIFANADLPVLIGSGSSWRTIEIVTFCRNNINLPQDRWRIVLPLATNDAREQMQSILRGRPVFNVPCYTEPFSVQDDEDETLQGILSPVLPQKRKRKLFGFLA